VIIDFIKPSFTSWIIPPDVSAVTKFVKPSMDRSTQFTLQCNCTLEENSLTACLLWGCVHGRFLIPRTEPISVPRFLKLSPRSVSSSVSGLESVCSRLVYGCSPSPESISEFRTKSMRWVILSSDCHETSSNQRVSYISLLNLYTFICVLPKNPDFAKT